MAKDLWPLMKARCMSGASMARSRTICCTRFSIAMRLARSPRIFPASSRSDESNLVCPPIAASPLVRLHRGSSYAVATECVMPGAQRREKPANSAAARSSTLAMVSILKGLAINRIRMAWT
jgi:hypothetical protein